MDFLKQFLNKLIYGGGVIFDLAKWFILVLLVLVIFNTFFYAIFIVDGESMDPTLKDRSWVFWDRNVYRNQKPERGDIVVINYPGDPYHKEYVKRVIGLPGEKIAIKNGSVYINDAILSERYISFLVKTSPDGVWQLGNKEYFVLGDNRMNSNDSRYFGPVESRFVLGKALTIVFPSFKKLYGV